jgi:hypothetical protein
MRPLDCAKCYQAAERSGALVIQLTKAAQALHDRLGHTKFNWMYCLEAPCPAHAAAVRGKPAGAEPVQNKADQPAGKV